MAFGVLRAIQERGLSAPADVAVVGFDDIPLARYMHPALSTVGASRFEWGATAVRQLIAFLDHDTPLQPKRMPTHFLARQSSDRSGGAPANT
jgi:DNA-binding LacI/PurR family transcriptional regulator